MDVRTTLTKFDEYLAQKNARFEAIVIGGAALNIMGVIQRDTIDVDCLDPSVPAEILKLAAEFRRSFPELKLIEKWINNGPDSLMRDLPKGWRKGVVPIFSGKVLHLTTLSRLDLLRTKLFAFCDRDQDLQDCIALKPSAREVDACLDWVSERDANPEWSENVRGHFALLKKRLGYDEK
jgi:hypothetical protein